MLVVVSFVFFFFWMSCLLATRLLQPLVLLQLHECHRHSRTLIELLTSNGSSNYNKSNKKRDHSLKDGASFALWCCKGTLKLLPSNTSVACMYPCVQESVKSRLMCQQWAVHANAAAKWAGKVAFTASKRLNWPPAQQQLRDMLSSASSTVHAAVAHDAYKHNCIVTLLATVVVIIIVACDCCHTAEFFNPLCFSYLLLSISFAVFT